MKLAFAGFRHGHINALYMSALRKEEVEITGCWEEAAAAREQAEKVLGCSFCYADYEELLGDESVDAVAIGDYYQKRGNLIIKALKAGKHVISDKPLCTDPGELAQIRRLCEETGKKVSIMLDLRFMGAAQKARELIQNGTIGEVTAVFFTGQHGLDYEHRPGWYFEEGKHGGTINDIAIHGVDLVRYITGKNLSSVTAAKTWNRYAVKAPAFKDCAQFMAEMEGIALMADVSYAAPEYDGILPTYWNFDFWGTKGLIRFCFAEENILHLYRESETVYECPACGTDLLTEFGKEIAGEPNRLETFDMLESAGQTLEIQLAAV